MRPLRVLRRLLPAVVLCLLAVPAPAAPLGTREVLPNGLVVLVAEKPAVPIVTVTVLIQAGSILDPVEKPGVANLTAKLLMQGTAARSAIEIKDAIDFVGGALSVDAGHDLTQISLSILSKDLDRGLDLLADVLQHPAFGPGEIARTAAEVLAGIRRKRDNPGTVSAETFAALVYGASPYGRPVEGSQTSVPTITRDDLVRFHQAYYRPDHAILAVVGDVRLPDLRRRLEARLGSWQRGNVEIPVPPAPAPLTASVVRTIQRDVTQANITLGHLGVRREDPDYYPLQVMNYILGGGFSSRLVEKIRQEKGWAYSVRSVLDAGKYAGDFSVSLQTRNAAAREAVDAVLQEMRRMRDQPVGATELADAKAYLTGSFPLRLDTNGKISRWLAFVEFYGLGPDYLDRYADFINAVTAADIQRVAQQYLHPDRIVVSAVADLAKAQIKE